MRKRIFLWEKTELPGTHRLGIADTAPPWRRYREKSNTNLAERRARQMDIDQMERGRTYRSTEEIARAVDAALVLRRPLLVTGPAGIGKSTLAYAVSYQLGLGNILRWGITSQTSLKDGLYEYDALARLRDVQTSIQTDLSTAALKNPQEQKKEVEDIGKYITLGPLGTALLPTRVEGYFPRVLLIDEIDKSDPDFPSDLLHILEEGKFLIPEIQRLGRQVESTVTVRTWDRDSCSESVSSDGWIECDDFPFIVMTSNREREFPPAFLRRCLRLDLDLQEIELREIINKHFPNHVPSVVSDELFRVFIEKIRKGDAVATDQLLNAIFLIGDSNSWSGEKDFIVSTILRSLGVDASQGLDE
jgi:MoxR-like ATPase